MSRRTFDQIRAEARKDAIAEACRVLKHHMQQVRVADELYELMNSSSEKKQVPAHFLQQGSE